MSQFVVVVFSDKASADTGSLCLKKLGTEGMTIYRSVVLSKNLEGQISMSDRVEEKSYTTIVAALIGGLAGLPAGLEAAAAGTAGGALFGLSAEFTNRGASSQFVDKLRVNSRAVNSPLSQRLRRRASHRSKEA